MKIDGPFQGKLDKKIFIISCVGILILCSIIGMIYTKHMCRNLHAKLQTCYLKRDSLNNEWTQFFLEKSILISNELVEQVTCNKFNIILPSNLNLI